MRPPNVEPEPEPDPGPPTGPPTDPQPDPESDPEPDEDDSDLVEQLVFRCLESDDVEAAAADLCAQHPEVAPRLRRVLARLQSAGFVQDESDRTRAPTAAPATAPATGSEMPIPERLGDFRMIRRLGAGGMGVVYLAHDEKLGRQVAVKIVRPEQLFFPGARVRFQREIEAIARLQHPGIVTIHSIGEEDGVPYFSMDYVRGVSISRLITNLAGDDPARLRERDLQEQVGSSSGSGSAASTDGSWNRLVIKIVRNVAEALDHAHAQGVIHRDVKPSNILIDEKLRPRLLDFGLARMHDAQQITRSTSHLGSLPYMAPEQFAGRADTPAPTLDVYALGVTMYELLTLHSPFLAETADETRANILAASPRPPRSVNSSVGADLETVCMTAMDPAPARRYQDMGAFLADLDNLLERRPIIARPVGPALRAWRWCQRHPTASVGIGMAVLLFVLTIGFAAVQLRNIRVAERTNYLLGITAASSQIDEQRSGEATASLLLCPDRLRHFEWNYLKLLADASTAQYRGHEGRVRWLDIHPNGREFVSVGDDGTLRFWNESAGSPTRTIALPNGRRTTIYCCAYSSDGDYVFACSSDHVVRRWDRDGANGIVLTKDDSGTVRRFAADPTGGRIACGFGDGRIRIVNMSGATLADIAMEQQPAMDTTTKSRDRRPTLALAYSRDGRTLFASQLHRIAIIDVARQKQIGTLLHDRGDIVTTLAPSSDGRRLLSAGTFGRTRVWDLATRRAVSSDASQTLGVNTGFFDEATGRIFVAGARGPILVYDAAGLAHRYTLLGHAGTVTRIALASDQRTVYSASYDGTIRRWYTDASVATRVIGRHRGVVRTLEVTNEGAHVITGGKDGQVLMWNIDSGERRLLAKHGKPGILATSLSPDGRELIVLADDLSIVDISGGRPPRVLPKPQGLRFVAWLPDGARFVGATTKKRLLLVDARNGTVLADNERPDTERSFVSAFVVCPWSDRIVVGTTTGCLLFVDSKSLNVEHAVAAHEKMVNALAVDRAARVLVSADIHGTIRFSDPRTGDEAEAAANFKDEVVSSIAFSPDHERMITSTMGRQIQIWDRTSKHRLTLLNGHDMAVQKSVFTPDGTRIVSISMDGSVRVWDSRRRED